MGAVSDEWKLMELGPNAIGVFCFRFPPSLCRLSFIIASLGKEGLNCWSQFNFATLFPRE